MDQNEKNNLNATILVIDDEPINLRILFEMLKSQGYQIRVARDGKSALSSVDIEPPDLILLDIQIPGMDGYEICMELKEQKHLRDIPIIFISALNQVFDKVKAFSSGGIDYITKPFQVEEVLARVETHLTLKKYQDQLEEIVEERTRELSTLNKKLLLEINERKQIELELIQSAKLSVMGEISAGIAHELKQPLNGINIISQSIIKDIEKNRLNIEELVDDLDIIVQQVNKMNKIIDHMRIFSRRSEKVDLVAIDITVVVEEALRFLEQQLKSHCILLTKKIPDNLPHILGDSIRIEQVFMNLITNAKDALTECQKKEKKIEINLYEDGSFIVVEVKDNGNGISEDKGNKIFQAFYTNKEPGKGTGLGLSISKRIIEQQNGIIEFSSEVGKGTIFKVKLPALSKK